MDENNILSKLDIETLKYLLKNSGMASDPGRENFCNNIGININNLSPRNLNNMNDDIFIDMLLKHLQATGNIPALQKLCEEIEPQFKDGFYKTDLQKIFRQLCIFTLIQILTEYDFKTKLNKECSSAYTQCLSHKKIQIGLKKIFNELLEEDIISLDQYKADFDSRFSLLDYFDAQKSTYKLASDILPFIQSDMSMSSLNNLSQELFPDNVLGRRFINKIKIEIVMEILFYSGIPFALWVREDIPEVNFEKELEEICQKSCLDTLSSIIKEKRIEARNGDNNYIGNYLSMLWDVHNLGPETNNLSMS